MRLHEECPEDLWEQLFFKHCSFKKRKIFSEQITFDFGSADLPVFKKNDVRVFKGLLLVAADKPMRCAMYTKSKQLGNTKCAFWDHKDCFSVWTSVS